MVRILISTPLTHFICLYLCVICDPKKGPNIAYCRLPLQSSHINGIIICVEGKKHGKTVQLCNINHHQQTITTTSTNQKIAGGTGSFENNHKPNTHTKKDFLAVRAILHQRQIIGSGVGWLSRFCCFGAFVVQTLGLVNVCVLRLQLCTITFAQFRSYTQTLMLPTRIGKRQTFEEQLKRYNAKWEMSMLGRGVAPNAKHYTHEMLNDTRFWVGILRDDYCICL